MLTFATTSSSNIEKGCQFLLTWPSPPPSPCPRLQPSPAPAPRMQPAPACSRGPLGPGLLWPLRAGALAFGHKHAQPLPRGDAWCRGWGRVWASKGPRGSQGRSAEPTGGNPGNQRKSQARVGNQLTPLQASKPQICGGGTPARVAVGVCRWSADRILFLGPRSFPVGAIN